MDLKPDNLIADIESAKRESIQAHTAWMDAPEGTPEKDAAKMAFLATHRRYVKAIDAFQAADPAAFTEWMGYIK